ncbi:MAG: hypothetical protein C4K60_12595 [Ideonella sp. MAG2]|nr:MAG: hypothetical protein C4K60_12595 [Ideonella sp. MAG2]
MVAASSDLQAAQRVVVLEEGKSPSGDYLLYPFLAQQTVAVLRCDSRQAPPPGLLRAGDFVVILRYLPAPWHKLLARMRPQLAGLAWFMDDDLWDPAVLRDLPKTYARKISSHALQHRDWCMAAGAQLWVSTPALAAKYAQNQPRVLPLAPLPDMVRPPAASIRVAYHGTASHQAELAWLHPVLAAVLSRSSTVHIEVFGDLAVNRQFRDLPRVTVLHPMAWERYRDYTTSHTLDIGLAPLLPTAFNQARGAVKFFDYARMGAFGLYADVPPYQGFVQHGQDGLLLPMNPGIWVETLLRLSTEEAERRRLAEGVQARVRALAGG